MDCDVLIIGGGPAGSATALALKKHAPSLSITLIESSSFDKPRIGEVLPSAAKNLLEHLGVWQFFEREKHLPVYSTLSAWGKAQFEENHTIFSTHGSGWHLDRQSFDAFLIEQAARAGVKVLLNTSLKNFTKNEQKWLVRLSDDSELNVRFIVDATGRRAFFTRKMKAEICAGDRLVSFSHFFTLDEKSAPETLVESFADGWWYAARAGKKRIVSCLTDADIAVGLGLSDREKWLALFGKTGQIKQSIGDGIIDKESITRPANSVCANKVCDSDWLAVGDAASAFDPLSSQGITKALRSAVFASYAIADLLVKNDLTAVSRYRKFIETEFAVYRKLYKKHYSNEQRWRENIFWQRRHSLD